MARTPKPKTVKGAARVKGKKGGKKAKPPVSEIPTDILTHLAAALSWLLRTHPAAKAMLGPGGGTQENCEICDACDAVPTGQEGLPKRDAFGTYGCLASPTSGDKYVKANTNGFYLSNL